MTKNTSKTGTSQKRLATILLVVTLGMFGFGFALVPLYNLMCDVLGINGKTALEVASQPDQLIDRSRLITVEFISVNNKEIPWLFKANDKSVRIHPGESKRVSYFAQNNSERTMTVQAIPSVAPGLMAKYLNKTECFCFEQQTLAPGETMEMPLVFYFDKSLPKDVPRITVAYTLFDVTDTFAKGVQS